MDKMISQADALVGAGKITEAKTIIDTLISNSPGNKAVFDDAVSILLAGNLYPEAKNLFKLYKSQTGEDLHAGFTISDIEAMEKKDVSPKGHFEALYQWQPWGPKAIIITNENLTIRYRRSVMTYRWDEITEAKVTLIHIPRGAGRVQKIRLHTKGRTIKLRLSPNVPSFKNEGQILPSLKSHLDFQIYNKNDNSGAYTVIAFIVIAVLIALTE